MARSVISPTDSSFWFWMVSPFSFEENISSLETVENLASAGALPVVLALSAMAGLARIASDAAINAIFFMFSSSAELPIYNERTERLCRSIRGRLSGRCAMGVLIKPRQQRLRRVARPQICDADLGLGASVALAV